MKLSPMQMFNRCIKIWLVTTVLLFGGCAVGVHYDAPYTEKVSLDATLVSAYSTMQRCKKSRSCEEYKGRFTIKGDSTYPSATYDRAIDGFFYHRYVDEGKKPMPAYLTLSQNDRGVKSPTWIIWLIGCGFFGAFVFVVGVICAMFGSIDAEEAQRKWELEQKCKEWRNY